MSWTDAERAKIVTFHAERGFIDSVNIQELATSLSKTVASVRTVAARAGLYTKKGAKTSSVKSTSAEATEIANYISQLASVNLDTLVRMDLGQLKMLKGYIMAIGNQW